jgi:methionyl-tRNA formyltransferase
MRIVLFANNWVGRQIASWLREQGEEIVALVLHPLERRTFGEQIIQAAGAKPDSIFDGSKLSDPVVLQAIVRRCPEIGVSALFGYILRPECIRPLPRGCVNLHPALLPYNRGANPNIWSIVDRTPAGVTLHYIDEGIDSGDIIRQRKVEVDPIDTGLTLYRKLEEAAVELFRECWPFVRAGRVERTPQHQGGTFHKLRDVQSIDEIELDRTYTARLLIDILRARTFPPYPGAFFRDQGRKIYLRLQLFNEEEVKGSDGHERIHRD